MFYNTLLDCFKCKRTVEYRTVSFHIDSNFLHRTLLYHIIFVLKLEHFPYNETLCHYHAHGSICNFPVEALYMKHFQKMLIEICVEIVILKTNIHTYLDLVIKNAIYQREEMTVALQRTNILLQWPYYMHRTHRTSRISNIRNRISSRLQLCLLD